MRIISGREESAQPSSPLLRSKNVFGLDDRNPKPFFTAEKRRRRKESKGRELLLNRPLWLWLFRSRNSVLKRVGRL
jgi:hypothetical protein